MRFVIALLQYNDTNNRFIVDEMPCHTSLLIPDY
jgi:hypothetical protein